MIKAAMSKNLSKKCVSSPITGTIKQTNAGSIQTKYLNNKLRVRVGPSELLTSHVKKFLGGFSDFRIFLRYTLPATIDLRNGEMGAVTVSDANIESGYSVKVYCTNISENGIRLYHTEDSNISITCTLIDINNNCNYTGETPLATFTQSEFTDATLTKYFGLEIIDRWSRAGDYVGTMQYSFECSPVAE